MKFMHIFSSGIMQMIFIYYEAAAMHSISQSIVVKILHK